MLAWKSQAAPSRQVKIKADSTNWNAFTSYSTLYCLRRVGKDVDILETFLIPGKISLLQETGKTAHAEKLMESRPPKKH